MIRISFEDLKKEYLRILLSRNMESKRAEQLALSFTTMAWEGNYSHGVNRFPVFIGMVDSGNIKLNAAPIKINSLGALEQWDCQFGPGPLNAQVGIDRAIELAQEYGVGVVAFKNSNHWMRGGTYALHAAKLGYVSIAFTNSIAAMPAWGATDPRIGNNPLIMGIPGEPPALLDMATSQYSFGKLELARLSNQKLEVAGGYDIHGKPSTDPFEIEKGKRVMPMGFWKGSGLAIVIDMLVTIVSGGISTLEITEKNGIDTGQSQLFIVFNTKATMPHNELLAKLKSIVDYTKKSVLADKNNPLRIPGESIEKFINDHKINGGIPIHESVWQKITSL